MIVIDNTEAQIIDELGLPTMRLSHANDRVTFIYSDIRKVNVMVLKRDHDGIWRLCRQSTMSVNEAKRRLVDKP